MSNCASGNHEQLSPELWIQHAYAAFNRSMLATNAQLLVFGGYTNSNDAKQAWLRKKRPDLDLRRKLTLEDQQLVDFIEDVSKDTDEYVASLRVEGGQPLYRNSVLSYFEAFENCLKQIAIALDLIRIGNSDVRAVQLFVKDPVFKGSRKRIEEAWSKGLSDKTNRSRVFFNEFVRTDAALQIYPNLAIHVPENVWDLINDGNKLRNRIVHGFGYLPERLTIADYVLFEGETANLTPSILKEIRQALETVLCPFGLPHSLGII